MFIIIVSGLAVGSFLKPWKNPCKFPIVLTLNVRRKVNPECNSSREVGLWKKCAISSQRIVLGVRLLCAARARRNNLQKTWQMTVPQVWKAPSTGWLGPSETKWFLVIKKHLLGFFCDANNAGPLQNQIVYAKANSSLLIFAFILSRNKKFEVFVESRGL